MNSSQAKSEGEFEKVVIGYGISLIVINIFSSLMACIMNLFIILTFVKKPSMRTPSYILIFCLAIADFGVGALVQPGFCVELFAKMKGYKLLFRMSFNLRAGSAWVLAASSFLTITAITIDRFLALHLHLRYQELVTNKRMSIVVIIIFTASLFGIFAQVSRYVKLFFVFGLMVLLLLNVFLMAKISRAVSKHSAAIHAQEQSIQESLNLRRYKKTVNTMHYIMGTFVVCYIPVTALHIVHFGYPLLIYYCPLLHITLDLTYTLMLINSFLNPVIYFWRIQEMRKALL